MRQPQADMISLIEDVLSSGGHAVIEAPTGFGKTVSALYPSVKFALSNGKKILYLVRTNSQERKVIEEAKKLGVLAVGLQGRRHMCPLSGEREDMENASAEEISLLCSKLKRDVERGSKDACPFFYGYREAGEEIREFIRETRTAEEIYRRAYELGVCPYEAVKDVMGEATVVALPYIYFLLPFLRNTIMERMGVDMRDLIVIVDEAHNFPDFARELRSDELTENALESMEHECLEFGNGQVLGRPCADVAEFIREAMYRLSDEVEGEEGIVPQYALEENIAEIMGIGINDVPRMAMELLRYGIEIREVKMQRRKIPRSHVYHAGSFLVNWKQSHTHEFLHLVKRGRQVSLEIFCLDPSPLTELVRSAYASIHMSGTLVLDRYRDMVNLPEDTVLRRFPSPFPKENLLVLYVDDVTTRYGEVDDNIGRIAEYIEEIAKLGRSTIVFFPSYSVMNAVLNSTYVDVITEERGMKQSELEGRVNEFRRHGGVLFSVFGGRVSEGIDFPGRELEIVVIAGIPYPKPTPRQKVLEKYYDFKFGNGWEFAFKMPAAIKIRQAIGRLIRSENDRGVAIILDRRAVHFADHIAMRRAIDPVREIEEFFRQGE